MITPTLDLERSLAAQGYDLIAGFDEVGRGALAGPVMVGCAAIWARDLEPLDGDDAVELSGRTYLGVPDGVADSKMLTEHRREAIFDELRDWCAAYAVARPATPRSTNGASPTRLAWPPCARSAKSNANLAYDLEGNRR